MNKNIISITPSFLFIGLLSLFVFISSFKLSAQNFDAYFTGKTLRLDYIFSGNDHTQLIALDELSKIDGWAGRRHHLDELPLKGNGQIIVKDSASGHIIYETSFSSLFQEWVETSEASKLTKAFQNTFLIPFPQNKISVEINLLDNKQKLSAQLIHTIDPTDILIKEKGKKSISPYTYLLKSGSEEDCIDIAILGEGYSAKEQTLLKKDAITALESLFNHEPFKSLKNKFNVVLVNAPSKDSGVSTPRMKDWRSTTFNSHFDTFYSDRYLTTNETKKIHDVLAGIPYEHIIVLANSEVYGGGGIYNAFTLTSAHHKFYKPVIVHEFGHSFGGLADEYFYDQDVMTDTYSKTTEPWEQNITTLIDFDSKWKNLLAPHTPVPTPASDYKKYPVGVYEGAAYSAKGVYRGSDDCRMRTNTAEAFCPVCQQALRKLILFYTDKN